MTSLKVTPPDSSVSTTWTNPATDISYTWNSKIKAWDVADLPSQPEPSSLLPLTLKANGEIYVVDTVLEFGAGETINFEIETSPETQNLSKTYSWKKRTGDGTFTSSSQESTVTYRTGTGGFETVSCGVVAPDALEPSVASPVIQMFITH